MATSKYKQNTNKKGDVEVASQIVDKSLLLDLYNYYNHVIIKIHMYILWHVAS